MLWYINKSGLNIPVHQYPWEGSTHIGTIYANEIFTAVGIPNLSPDFGGVKFKNINNQYIDGNISAPESAYTTIDDFPLGTCSITGQTYPYFTLRRSEEVYDSSGTQIGSVATGDRVVIGQTTAGPNDDRIDLVFWESGGWHRDGYMHTGIQTNSLGNVFSINGNW